MSQVWTSEPLAVERADDAPWSSAELLFEDVRHDGPSFVVQIYLAKPNSATSDASSEAEPPGDPAARFTVFAHGNCWGDVGHCELPPGPIHPYDRRPPHPLTPRTLRVEVTDALQALGDDVGEVAVTAVAHSTDPEHEQPLRFGRLTLLTYD